jgi:hypothetical protein
VAAKSEIDAKLNALRDRSGTGAALAAANEDATPAHGFHSLNLVKTNGEQSGFPYSGLSSQHFDKAKGTITLRFTFKEVTIKGKALDQLYERILNRTVGVIVEATANKQLFSDGKEAIAESITVSDSE